MGNKNIEQTTFTLKCARYNNEISYEKLARSLLSNAYEKALEHYYLDNDECTPTKNVSVGSDDLLILGAYLKWKKDPANDLGMEQFVHFIWTFNVTQMHQNIALTPI